MVHRSADDVKQLLDPVMPGTSLEFQEQVVMESPEIVETIMRAQQLPFAEVRFEM